jgi:hypothetical protein
VSDNDDGEPCAPAWMDDTDNKFDYDDDEDVLTRDV